MNVPYYRRVNWAKDWNMGIRKIHGRPREHDEVAKKALLSEDLSAARKDHKNVNADGTIKRQMIVDMDMALTLAKEKHSYSRFLINL